MLKDILGRAFKAGQTVVYPGRHSSSLWLNVGQIIAVDPNGKGALVVRPTRSNRNVHVQDLTRVAIIPQASDYAAPVADIVFRAGERRDDATSVTPGTGLDV